MAREGLSAWKWEKAKAQILQAQTVCAYCGEPVDRTLKWPDPGSATVDHIIPITRGGDPYALHNLNLMHNRCNRTKSDGVRPNNPTSRRWLST